MDILLVLGDITAEQYTLLTGEMIRNGLQPKVVISTENVEEEWYQCESSAHRVASKKVTNQGDEYWVAVAEESDKRFNAYVRDLLGDAQLTEVKAVLMRDTNDFPEDNMYLRITALLHVDIPTYTLQMFEGTYFELHGNGFNPRLVP